MHQSFRDRNPSRENRILILDATTLRFVTSASGLEMSATTAAGEVLATLPIATGDDTPAWEAQQSLAYQLMHEALLTARVMRPESPGGRVRGTRVGYYYPHTGHLAVLRGDAAQTASIATFTTDAGFLKMPAEGIFGTFGKEDTEIRVSPSGKQRTYKRTDPRSASPFGRMFANV